MPHAAARIFVRIPAYRDPEVLETIARLFERADHPERVSVGVCWQYADDEGPLELPADWPAEHRARVRIDAVPAAESRGPCWARHRAEALLEDEDFVLGVDAHTQPAIDWDAALLDEWGRCGPRALLSGPLAGYKPPDLLRSNPRSGFRRPSAVNHGLLVLRTGFFDGYPDGPVPVAFAHRRFVFAPAECIREVPTDPALYLEDDVAYSLRLFTHGWDVHAPSDVYLWHRFNDDGEQRPLHWKTHPDWRRIRAAARTRVRRLTGAEPLRAHERPDDDPRFGLGEARTREAFFAFCGFDLAAGRPLPDADRCPFVEAIRPVTTLDGYWITPPAPEPIPMVPELAVGDCAPYVRLPMANGRRGELQLYAGAPVALFFVPADAPAAGPFVELLIRRRADFEAAGVQPLIVAVGARAKRIRTPGRPTVWLDEHGAVAQSFGSGPNGERAFLLDRNLRVVAHHTGLTAGAVGALIDGGRALAEADLRPPRTIAPHPPVLVVPDAIDAALRAALIEAWQAGDHFQGRTGSGAGSKVRLGHKVRTDVQLTRDVRARVDAALTGRLLPEIAKVFGFFPTRREAYKVGCYPADSGGFFGQHRDNFEPALAHRRVAMTLNLNDDFEGGRLVFPEYGPDGYAPAAGTAVIFPCALMHRVDPVTAGRRFTLVSFFHDEAGARLRRQMRRGAGLPPPDDDRRFTAPRRGVVTHHEDVRHRYAVERPANDETPLRPLTLIEARGAGNPEGGVMRRDTPPGVMVIDHYLHPDACRRITDYALAAPGRPLQVLDHSKSSKDALVTTASDKRITEKVRIDGLAPEILALFTDVYGHRLEPHYGVEFEWFERPQILRYGPGGKYHAHADAEHYDRALGRYVRAQDRDYSVLVYVNDDYEGGAIAFPKLGYEVQPRAGMLIAFPSDHRYEHAALPTTAGTRLALVSWAAVRGTPRVRPRAPFSAIHLRPR